MIPAPRIAWALAAAFYFVVTTLFHLRFSLWLVAERTLVWQGQTLAYNLRDFIPYLLAPMALAWVAWLLHSTRRHGTRQRLAVVGGYWLVWLGCVAAVDRWLTYSVAEYFHYPQYALLAILLAKSIDSHRKRWPITRLLLLTSMLGALDELAQYLWITVSYSHYYDFNDVLVNLLAAVLGVMLYYGVRVPPPAQRLRPDTASAALLLAVALVCVAAGAAGRLGITPPAQVPPGGITAGFDGKPTLYLQRKAGLYGGWQPGHLRTQYRVLGPATALGAISLIWLTWLPWGIARTNSYGPQKYHRYDPAAIPTPAQQT